MDEPVITCPNCGGEIKLTETLAAPIIEAERAKLRTKLEAERVAIAREETRKARERAERALAEKLEKAKKALAEKTAKLEQAQRKELESRRRREALEDEKRTLELKMTRRFDADRKKIRQVALGERDEEHRLKLLEKDKVIGDMCKQIDELRRKSEQGSGQLAGEVQELDLESMLRRRFPNDDLEPVPTGRRGGDLLQRVRDARGRECGTILWESKRTRLWNNQWLPKLRDDQRAAKADVATLMTTTLPKSVKTFDHVDGVWITNPECAMPLSAALRLALIEAAAGRRASEGRRDKMDAMYGYLTGPHFRQRVAAIVESYVTMQSDLEAERRSMVRTWAKREKQLERMLEGAAGMYGDVQGILGASLPEVEGLSVAALDPPETETVVVANGGPKLFEADP